MHITGWSPESNFSIYTQGKKRKESTPLIVLSTVMFTSRCDVIFRWYNHHHFLSTIWEGETD